VGVTCEAVAPSNSSVSPAPKPSMVGSADPPPTASVPLFAVKSTAFGVMVPPFTASSPPVMTMAAASSVPDVAMVVVPAA
jgi:hypothetical protein